MSIGSTLRDAKMRTVILCGSFGLLFLGANPLFALDILGATVDGRKVVLHSDGTWEFKQRASLSGADALALYDFDKTDLAPEIGSEDRSKKVRLTLYVKNTNPKKVKAWKARLTVRNPFNEVLVQTALQEGGADLEPNAVQRVVVEWRDKEFDEEDIYDKLISFKKENLNLSLTDIQTVQ